MKSFRPNFRNLPSLHYGERFRPVRDWLILLAVAGVILVASFAYNIWLFNRVASGENLGEAPATTLPTFNRDSLETVKKLFEQRKVEEAKYAGGDYHFVDPSK